jgi:hypothetical protein
VAVATPDETQKPKATATFFLMKKRIENPQTNAATDNSQANQTLQHRQSKDEAYCNQRQPYINHRRQHPSASKDTNDASFQP